LLDLGTFEWQVNIPQTFIKEVDDASAFPHAH
jgi:hypothetical protein